jgi:hypothetical protein
MLLVAVQRSFGYSAYPVSIAVFIGTHASINPAM